jgi:FG-GAP repeat
MHGQRKDNTMPRPGHGLRIFLTRRQHFPGKKWHLRRDPPRSDDRLQRLRPKERWRWLNARVVATTQPIGAADVNRTGPRRRSPSRVASGTLAVLALTGPVTLSWAALPPVPIGPALVSLDPSGMGPGAGFGTSVAAAATTLVVGAPMLGAGAVYVYTRDARGWRETTELHGPRAQPGEFFGGAVAIAGGTVVVGADNYESTGAAYVFRREGSSWHRVADLFGAGDRPGSGFGYSVAIAEGTIVVGAPMPVLGSGAAYLFREDGRGWHQVADFRGQNAPVGGLLGFSVAAAGLVAVVGDPGGMLGAGRAYVFSTTSTGWRETAQLVGRDTERGDNFGFSVALSAGRILVGAPWHGAGAAYLFRASLRGWRQTAQVSEGGSKPGAQFGYSASLGLGLAAVGAPGTNRGRAYLFSQRRWALRQTAELAGPSTSASYFGSATAMSGTSVVIGADGYHAGTGAAWASTS